LSEADGVSGDVEDLIGDAGLGMDDFSRQGSTCIGSLPIR
jgi:hypothetical protein